MDPTYPAHVEAFRQRVRRFLEERLPPGWQGIGRLGPDEAREFAARWRAELAAHGFLAPSWPKEYGGPGLSEIEQVVLFQELQAAGVPTGTQNDAFSIGMVGNTILRWAPVDHLSGAFLQFGVHEEEQFVVDDGAAESEPVQVC